MFQLDYLLKMVSREIVRLLVIDWGKPKETSENQIHCTLYSKFKIYNWLRKQCSPATFSPAAVQSAENGLAALST